MLQNKFFKTLSFLVVFALTIGVSNIFASNNTNSSSANIVDVAVQAGNFTTLVTALQATGLDAELVKEGPYTVFAPTDEAFAKLPEGTVENLLNDKEALKNILLYHVVSGEVMSKDVVNVDEAKTVSGNMLKVNAGDNGVMINKSKVTAVDIKASNGVIHVIDTVLLPE